MSVTYTTKGDIMKTKHEKRLSSIMVNAWTLARFGSREFGGTPFEYLRIALKFSWHDDKHPVVWKAGVGNQFWIPGVTLNNQEEKGLALFRGLSLQKLA